MSLLVNRASMKGMVVFDYADRYSEAAREMAGWLAAGRLKSREEIVDRLIEQAAEAATLRLDPKLAALIAKLLAVAGPAEEAAGASQNVALVR